MNKGTEHVGTCDCGSTDFQDIGRSQFGLIVSGVDLVACKECGRVYAKNLMKHE